MNKPIKSLIISLLLVLVIAACSRLVATLEPTPEAAVPGQNQFVPPHHVPNAPIQTPTPDIPHILPGLRTEETIYTVQANDTLKAIADMYSVPLETVIEKNQLADPDLLSIGQVLVIPPPEPHEPAPAIKIIPDSELVYGPYAEHFDLIEYVDKYDGQLTVYREKVNGQEMTGIEIVKLVSRNHSVNPRLLLALVEYQSGWITKRPAHLDQLSFPIGLKEPTHSGLYAQLNWAANTLNRGYYLWRVNGLPGWITMDGAVIPASPTINAGTAAVQYLFSQLYDLAGWRKAVIDQGFSSTYQQLFGYPFEWSYDPLFPPALAQPKLQLPFEPGVPWTFTGGPHGAWDDGSAWAAIDFAPPMELLGCYPNDAWVVAMSDGLIVRSDNGVVIQDLDGDGNEGTGWTLLYLHIGSEGRVSPGTLLKAGERIGHPSCEGGVSSGTHVHIARRYNGEWIPADGPLPFVLDGWVSAGAGILYEGTMQRGDIVIESCECQDLEHTLQR
jgi:LasA protease